MLDVHVPRKQCSTSYDTVYAEVFNPVIRLVCEKVHYSKVSCDATTQECSYLRLTVGSMIF